MKTYPFTLVNVFAETHFGGNPLAVFPQADGLTAAQMQAIAKQFNLSETVFAFPSATAADLRIFTPEHELPLAGHPTLGCAHVLQKKLDLPHQFLLNTPAKTVAVHARHGQVEMALQGYTVRPSLATRQQLADCLGLNPSAVAPQAYCVNSGSPQLLLQLLDPVAIEQVKADAAQLSEICRQDGERSCIYVWHEDGTNGTIRSRFFYDEQGVILEDGGTGSACANLGAYFLAQGRCPLHVQIHQGDQTGRPNRLSLKLDEHQTIYVGGRVVEVGEGVFRVA